MNKTINFATEDPEELKKMIQDHDDEAMNNNEDQADSFEGAFAEHFEQLEEAKSEEAKETEQESTN